MRPMNRNTPSTVLAILITSGIGLSIAAAIPSARDILPTDAETAAFCAATDPESQTADMYALCDNFYHRLDYLSDGLDSALYTDTATAYLYN